MRFRWKISARCWRISSRLREESDIREDASGKASQLRRFASSRICDFAASTDATLDKRLDTRHLILHRRTVVALRFIDAGSTVEAVDQAILREQRVVAGLAVEVVVAPAANQRVIAIAGPDRVVAAIADEH